MISVCMFRVQTATHKLFKKILKYILYDSEVEKYIILSLKSHIFLILIKFQRVVNIIHIWGEVCYSKLPVIQCVSVWIGECTGYTGHYRLRGEMFRSCCDVSINSISICCSRSCLKEDEWTVLPLVVNKNWHVVCVYIYIILKSFVSFLWNACKLLEYRITGSLLYIISWTC
jgi:hypothetical protein